MSQKRSSKRSGRTQDGLEIIHNNTKQKQNHGNLSRFISLSLSLSLSFSTFVFILFLKLVRETGKRNKVES